MLPFLQFPPIPSPVLFHLLSRSFSSANLIFSSSSSPVAFLPRVLSSRALSASYVLTSFLLSIIRSFYCRAARGQRRRRPGFLQRCRLHMACRRHHLAQSAHARRPFPRYIFTSLRRFSAVRDFLALLFVVVLCSSHRSSVCRTFFRDVSPVCRRSKGEFQHCYRGRKHVCPPLSENREGNVFALSVAVPH